MSKRTKRTDAHRPGAIEPERYSFRGLYALATTMNGWPVPSFNIDHVVKVQNEVAAAGGQVFGGPGTCGTCGAAFVYGEIWQHEDGDLLHLGHICARKYELIADRRLEELELKRHRARTAREHEAAIKLENFEAWVAAREGLAEAIEVGRSNEHPIICDIADRGVRFGSLTDPQVKLVTRLAHEILNPPEPEDHVPAPEGRVDFEGEVVSVKERDTEWGLTLKMTVKVREDDGVWLAWMTVPSSMINEVERGSRVAMRATLKRGRDDHFAFGKRPSGRVLTEAA